MENQAGVWILGDGLCLETTDLFERASPEEAAAARKKRAVVAIAAGLHHAEEQRLSVLELLFEAEVPLENIRVVEMMGRLDEGDRRVLEETDRFLEEGGHGDVVDVEHRHQLPVGLFKCVIEIAGLGMERPVGASEIRTSQRCRQLSRLIAVAVVEHIDLEPVFRIFLIDTAHQRPL